MPARYGFIINTSNTMYVHDCDSMQAFDTATRLLQRSDTDYIPFENNRAIPRPSRPLRPTTKPYDQEAA